MAYVFVSDGSPPTQSSISVAVAGLSQPANEYARIEIYCSNGTSRRVEGTFNGGTVGNYRSIVATFSGLNSDYPYTFRAEIQYNSTSVTENTDSITQRTLAPTATPPSTPSLSLLSVSGRRITWGITAGSNTERVYIDREWSTEIYSTVSSGGYFGWYYDAPADGTRYGIRVRGWNSQYGHGNYSSWVYGTTESTIIVGDVPSLLSNSVLQTSFKVSWGIATSASSYEIGIRVQGSSGWTTDYVGSSTRSYSFTNLVDQTYYEVRVRGYTGTTYGSYSTITVRTQAEKPSPLNWTTRTTGNNFDLTAKEWNDMTSKINAWRVYKGMGTTSFTVAVINNALTAAMFNQARNAIEELNPSVIAPESVVVGESVTAAKINRISTSIDSIN